MGEIINFKKTDPFAEAIESISNETHIRVFSRGRRKTTIIQGIPPDTNLKKLSSELQKKFNCSGSIKSDPNYGQIIKLSGDQRNGIRAYLISNKIASETNIKMHGV